MTSEVTNEMLQAAVKEAVRQGVLPKFSIGDEAYEKSWRAIEAVVGAALAVAPAARAEAAQEKRGTSPDVTVHDYLPGEANADQITELGSVDGAAYFSRDSEWMYVVIPSGDQWLVARGETMAHAIAATKPTSGQPTETYPTRELAIAHAIDAAGPCEELTGRLKARRLKP